MVYVGLVFLILTVWAMIKRFESRMVLIVAGILMCAAAGNLFAAFKGLTKGMTESDLICNICSVMAFAFVMTYTQCDKHLGRGVGKFLKPLNLILIPASVLATWFVNISLPSCAGVSAAIGSVVIPLLINAGVPPAMSAAAVMMGTYGSMLSPGLPHNPFVARIATRALASAPADYIATLAGKTEFTVMDVISRHTYASISAGITGAVVLWLYALITKENKGYVASENDNTDLDDGFKVNPFYAIIPVIPVVMLILGANLPKQLPWLAKLRVEHCMLIGAIIGLAATRMNPFEGSKQFFNGLGKGYANIMGIVIAAAVFVAGLNTTGLVKAGIDLMKSSPDAANYAAAIGPFLLAVICGSGNAATIAFNEAVTLHAWSLGVDPINMGAIATLAGCLGRCMSPLAGGMIVCAGMAKADPMEVAKRCCIPSIIALIVGYFVLIVFKL